MAGFSVQLPGAEPALPRYLDPMRRYFLHAVAATLLAGLLGVPAAGSALEDEGLQLEDRLDLLTLDRRLLAVSAESGRVLEVSLRPSERVLALESRGVIGVAATKYRLLGVTSESANWQEIRLRVGETAPEQLHVSERLALVALENRLLALPRETGIWSELELFPGEVPVRLAVESGVGLCVTGRRAIAVSDKGGGFVSTRLTPRETIEQVSLGTRSVTLQTRFRLLIFRSGSTRWVEQRRVDLLGLSPE
jgi:hypothetical protein